MNRLLRIYITGKDAWALGTEYRLAKACLSTFATIVDTPSEADFIHTVDVEETVSRIYRGDFIPEKTIVGAVNNHPTRLVEWPGFLRTACQHLHLVPQSTLAAADMKRLGISYPGQVRIATDSESYTAIPPDDPELIAFRKQIGLPGGVYIIGLLQRDSEGRDLTVPKRQKGPDIFLALMLLLKRKLSGNKFHVLLGGPRRHWIRNAFEQHDIPYTFVGKEIKGDDYPENILDKQTMCKLYNLLDLYVIPTRWEGAPRQVFDVLECGRKIISTPVGIAPDILSKDCIFDTLVQGVETIIKDIECGFLEPFSSKEKEVVEKYHSIKSVGHVWEKLYQLIPIDDRKRTTLSVRSSSASSFKPFSYILENTRLGQMRKEFFPKRLGVVKNTEEQSVLYPQVIEKLASLGVKVTDCPNEKNILVWNLPASNFESVSQYGEKQIILVLDEMCCKDLLMTSKDGGEVHPFLKYATTTIVTSDIDLVQLNHAGVSLNNPMVVPFSPDSSVFKPEQFARRKPHHKAQCLVFLDSNKKWNLDWLQVLEQHTSVTYTVIDDVAVDWIGKTDYERVAAMSKNDFAIVLTTMMTRQRVSELLACGLPCLYADSLCDINALIGMGGVGVGNIQFFRDGIDILCDHYDIFSEAISLPLLEESAIVLANIVYS